MPPTSVTNATLAFAAAGGADVGAAAPPPQALTANTSGINNSAFGTGAMAANTVGGYNSVLGQYALVSNTSGTGNSSVGQRTLNFNTTGGSNTALGLAALFYNTSGNRNIGLGQNAGANQTTGSDNIYIANTGVAAESGFIRIGTVGTQQRAFIAGISGIAIPGGGPVYINSSGLLGTTSVSSARYKQDIHDMGDSSDVLMKLRPVTFRYREDVVGAADSKDTRFGLIAEEVAQVAPQLTTSDDEGRPNSVKYHELPVLLLNETQKQQRTIDSQRELVASLATRLSAVETELAGLREHAAATPR